MKKTFFAPLLFTCALLASAPGFSDDSREERDQRTAAFSILGSSPFAHQNYGVNVVRGKAKLSPYGRSETLVTVKIDGLKPGTTHAGHIHGGTCVQLFPGTILFNLEPIVINASGSGASKTVIPATMAGFKDCEWWVAVHEGPANTTPQTPAVAIGPVLTRSATH